MPHYKKPLEYLFIATLFLLAMSEVCVALPKPINYQGYLTQPDGTPIDTTADMVVELWTAATGGSLLYSESHAAVTVSRGRFSIEISTGTPLSGTFDASHFQQDSWLALTINGELLTPRSRLGAVAGAQYSEIAGRLSTSCPDGNWLGFRNGALACYECDSGSTECYDGDPATRNVGECKAGTSSCVQGEYASACAGQVLPVAEICNSKDDDCNGLVDDGTSLPGCITNQYIDNDGDGYGDSVDSTAQCLCDSVPNRTDVGGDCADNDPDINPSASFFTVVSSLGTFDYNCNGIIEKNHSQPVASCTYNGSACDYVAGFAGSIPDCGEFGTLSNGCSQDGTTCTVTTGIIGVTMACR